MQAQRSHNQRFERPDFRWRTPQAGPQHLSTVDLLDNAYGPLATFLAMQLTLRDVQPTTTSMEWPSPLQPAFFGRTPSSADDPSLSGSSQPGEKVYNTRRELTEELRTSTSP